MSDQQPSYQTPPQPNPQYGQYQQPYQTYGPYGAQQQPYYPWPGAPQWVAGMPPSSNIGWAIAALILCWPFCIPSFIASSKVTGLWYSGRAQEAVRASEDAKKWGKIGVIVGICLSVVAIVVYVIVLVIIFHGIDSVNNTINSLPNS